MSQALLVAVALMTFELAALAQEVAPPACAAGEPDVCGKHHFARGTEAYERAAYAEAAREFELALGFKPHPVIDYNLGLSLSKAGKPLDALEAFARVARDARSDQSLRERAASEAKAAESAVSRIRFVLGDTRRMQVQVDGARQAPPLDDVRLNPGRHHVRVTDDSAVLYDEQLELRASERLEVRVGTPARTIDIVPVEKRLLVPQGERGVAPLERKPLAPIWFWTSVGISSSLVLLTIWSGLDTQATLDDFEQARAERDRQRAEELLNSGHDKELRTNLLLGASVASAAATAVLGAWYVDFGGGLRARAVLAPRHAGFAASF
jgi:tetratricopeptide (TPR) repeat protein